MAKDLDDALEEYLNSIKAIANMSYDDQTKITKAGAKVMADKLAEATRTKHAGDGTGGKYGHLADNTASQGKNIDGMKDGTSVAGFGDKAFVARFLNDGTKFMPGDHYVDDARTDATEDVLEAEAAEYKKLLAKKEQEG